MRSLPLVICLALIVVGLSSASVSAAERVYYIAADEVIWDYAPSYPNNPPWKLLWVKKVSPSR
jgi:manganese oxidase